MKTVSISDEPKTKNARIVDVTLGSVQVNFQTSLIDKSDKSSIMKGEMVSVNLGTHFSFNQEEVEVEKAAREKVIDAIESALAVYYQEINQ